MAAARTARTEILDAFETLLVDRGERAATLDAVAAAAGVSKGGLLYHFPSKAALADGMIERLRVVAEADLARLVGSPAGPIDYFLRSSGEIGTELDRALSAVTRLDQSGSYPQARAALDAVVAGWLDALTEAIGDPVVGRLVAVLGDGLYFNTSLAGRDDAVGTGRVTPDELDAMIAAMQELARSRDARG